MFLKTRDYGIIKKYTVENKNIAHLERILKRKVWQNRTISLRTKMNDGNYYLPLGAKGLLNQDIDKFHSEILDIKFNGEIRDYQKSAINHILWNGCGLIDLKTGGGKSIIAMGIISAIKRSTLIIVPTTKLLLEMQDKIREFMGYEAGIFYSAKKEIKPITITTSKSYCENDFGKFDCICVDECDSGLSERFRDKIIMSDCNYLVGMTGTPSRIELDANDLTLFYGPYIQVGGYQEIPTETIQYIYKRTREEEYACTGNNFADSRTMMIANENRAKSIIEKVLELKKKYNIILILTDRVEEAEMVGDRIPGCIVIHGNTKLKDDNASIELIKQNGGIIVGTRQKMGRGVDIPAIDCVCLIGSFKFRPSVIQAIGRALRKFPGKIDIGLYIFSDDILKSQMYANKKTCEDEYGIVVNREILNK